MGEKEINREGVRERGRERSKKEEREGEERVCEREREREERERDREREVSEQLPWYSDLTLCLCRQIGLLWIYGLHSSQPVTGDVMN